MTNDSHFSVVLEVDIEIRYLLKRCNKDKILIKYCPGTFTIKVVIKAHYFFFSCSVNDFFFRRRRK